MFLPRISQPNCASAWLHASQSVHALPGHQSNHVVIDVEDPVSQSDDERIVVQAVDSFIERHLENGLPVRSVANTIFPQATYEDHGKPDFYGVYIEKVFPRLKRSPRDWGRYFERMMAYPSPEGPVNLLDELLETMKKNIASSSPFRNIYELPIYNPLKDAHSSPRGRQCLSYLSFKLDKDRRLLLSAVYRNHYYTEKLLGNLIGLGRLMAFVATEAAIAVGPLTVLSTHAEVDTAGATQAELKELHDRCAGILGASGH